MRVFDLYELSYRELLDAYKGKNISEKKIFLSNALRLKSNLYSLLISFPKTTDEKKTEIKITIKKLEQLITNLKEKKKLDELITTLKEEKK